MARIRMLGLTWLEQDDVDQHFWAEEYLYAKGLKNCFQFRDITPSYQPLSHEHLLLVGMEIEREEAARGVFRDMKDAWRQVRNRKNKKDNGYQTCAFSIKATTIVMLQEMAQTQQTTATGVLEKLIAKAHKSNSIKATKQRSPKALPKSGASNAFAKRHAPENAAEPPLYEEQIIHTQIATSSQLVDFTQTTANLSTPETEMPTITDSGGTTKRSPPPQEATIPHASSPRTGLKGVQLRRKRQYKPNGKLELYTELEVNPAPTAVDPKKAQD